MSGKRWPITLVTVSTRTLKQAFLEAYRREHPGAFAQEAHEPWLKFWKTIESTAKVIEVTPEQAKEMLT